MTQTRQTPTQTNSLSAGSVSCYLSKILSIQGTVPFRGVVSAGPSEAVIHAMKRVRQFLQLRAASLLTTDGALLCAHGSTF